MLKHAQDIPLTDEILEEAYRDELRVNSHFSVDEETFSDYRLWGLRLNSFN